MKKLTTIILLLALLLTFSGCGNGKFEYRYDEAEGGIVITKHRGGSGHVRIPETIDGKPVRVIGEGAFAMNSGGEWTFKFRDTYSGPKSVIIPAGVTKIGASAFFGARLTSVTIPDGVTEIAPGTFADCFYLTNVTIPDSVTKIGANAFYRCNLKSVTIPAGVTEIEEHAFESCRGLTSVTIPDGVRKIGRGAFAICTGLRDVTIPDSVTEIGYSMFFECTDLNVTYQGKTYRFVRPSVKSDDPHQFFNYYPDPGEVEIERY